MYPNHEPGINEFYYRKQCQFILEIKYKPSRGVVISWNCEMPFRESPVENKLIDMSYKLEKCFPPSTPIFASELVLHFILEYYFK